MIYSELSHAVSKQSELQIELFADVLWKVPLDSLEYLNLKDIQDILRSCSQTELYYFQENAAKLLSTECPICGNSFPCSRMETMFLCHHICCLDCAKNYYRGTIPQIRDSQTLKKLTCFENAVELTDETKLNFFQYLESKVS